MKVKAYKAKCVDPFGNGHYIYINESGHVSLCNEHRISLSLSNIAYAITPMRSTAECQRIVTEAARNGIESLRAVTKINWVEIKS